MGRESEAVACYSVQKQTQARGNTGAGGPGRLTLALVEDLARRGDLEPSVEDCERQAGAHVNGQLLLQSQ